MNQKQANRAQRRKEAREDKTPKSLRGTTEQILTRMAKGGITIQDLEANYNVGLQEGRKQGIEMVFTIVYAAAILTCHEQLHFGHDRSKRFVTRMDELVTSELLSMDDAAKKVWDAVQISMNFKNGFTFDPFD